MTDIYWVAWSTEKAMAPHSSTLARKIHGQRSLVRCSPWGRWGSDTTQWLHFLFSLSYIGEGNGNPLQCSCLENPRGGEAWWAAVFGVAQSWTWRLKRLSSSSSSNSVLETDTVHKIQVLSDAGILLKPHPQWLLGFVLNIWTTVTSLWFLTAIFSLMVKADIGHKTGCWVSMKFKPNHI